ncbi:hypothetical protein TNIN_412421 [Trichonephila inaurata madagascariensis]|uniref:Uncharacterized protein n=1 Tax=Trichonephila inaurata madagascariensis TaxID=2747483 RepID=A0A8X6XCA6_9ARAC|nr:hypothetical protein TNIN_412421 [Trichonephila inaurata madagascariensis]
MAESVQKLSTILSGIRNTYKDLGTTSAEQVYDANLRLPGESSFSGTCSLHPSFLHRGTTTLHRPTPSIGPETKGFRGPNCTHQETSFGRLSLKLPLYLRRTYRED